MENMNNVKVAIPYEMAETIANYCENNQDCDFCIFANWGNRCDYKPYKWNLDAMRVEGKGNG